MQTHEEATLALPECPLCGDRARLCEDGVASGVDEVAVCFGCFRSDRFFLRDGICVTVSLTPRVPAPRTAQGQEIPLLTAQGREIPARVVLSNRPGCSGHYIWGGDAWVEVEDTRSEDTWVEDTWGETRKVVRVLSDSPDDLYLLLSDGREVRLLWRSQEEAPDAE